MPKQSKGGASRKVPDGLTVAIPLRGDKALVDALDALKDKRNAENPGTTLSRADVIRNILWAALRRVIGVDDVVAYEPPATRAYKAKVAGRKGARS